MKVFIASSGQDTGGQGYKIVQAFQRHAPDWSVRSMRVSDNWLRFPHDLKWDTYKAEQLYDAADVVHHQNGLPLYASLDKGQKKPTVVHHQGTRLRRNPLQVSLEGDSVGAKALVSTVDLLEDCPGAEWLPQPCDIDYVASFRRKNKNGPFRIGHSPTNRTAKNTLGILEVLNRLSKRYKIEVDLIEGIQWTACLSRKGRCDIFIDQMTLGYGNSGIEAMAMGIPTVSGWQEPQDQKTFTQKYGDLVPFVEANISTLEVELEILLTNPYYYQVASERCREFSQYHSFEKTVERLKRIYQETPPSSGELRVFNPARKGNDVWTPMETFAPSVR